MTDEQLALQAVSDAQRILEEYLEPRPRITSASSWTSWWKCSSGQIFWSLFIGCSAARKRSVVPPLLVGSCEFEPVLSKL
ncbi:hypothetical protein ACVWZW_001254 [Bradyrhizobium sp. F1.13.4]